MVKHRRHVCVCLGCECARLCCLCVCVCVCLSVCVCVNVFARGCASAGVGTVAGMNEPKSGLRIGGAQEGAVVANSKSGSR